MKKIVFTNLIFILSACEVATIVETPTTPSNGSLHGTLDITQAWPGSGEYTGYNAAALPASRVCSSGSVFGVSGTSVCGAGTMTDPASLAQVLSGKEYWDSTGTLRTGTLSTSSPSSTDINHASQTTRVYTPTAGSLYNGVTIDLSADFTAANICAGKTIFGRLGTAACGAIPGSIEHILSSQMHRNRGGARMTVSGEGVLAIPAHYARIPRPTLDDEGTTGTNVTKSTRPTVICGKNLPTVQDRIDDCVAQNPSTSTWSGESNGNSGESSWSLVTLLDGTANTNGTTASGGFIYEVWRDNRTGLLWSDPIQTATNWCRAAGVVSNVGGVDCTPGGSLQPASPISLCAEVPGLTTSSTHDPVKGGMRAVATGTTPSVIWRLPTIYDWKQADLDGVRHVLARTEDALGGTRGGCNQSTVFCVFWSATTKAHNRGRVHIFAGDDGSNMFENSDETFKTDTTKVFTRCVGREAP